MSFADEARDALHRAARMSSTPVHTAGVAYAKARQEIVAATDLVEVMGRAVDLIVAAEQLARIAAEAEKEMRAILAQTMNDTGCPQVASAGQLAYVSRKPVWVSVDQTDLVPSEYMHQPAPSPDKKAIKAAIEAGEDVPGCSLVRPNEVTLAIRVKKE